MKILIVYDSKYGNNKQIAELIAEKMRNANNEVRVHYAKDITPKQALEFSPEIFLFGGPIRAGMVSFTIKRWTSRFSGLLAKKRITLAKAAVWATHGVFPPDTPERFAWKNIARKWETLFGKVPASKKLPGITDISVEGMEGPLESGWQTKINEFVEKLTNL
jgi:menaquinone-dependent protoporphyrinogen IX oxidase